MTTPIAMRQLLKESDVAEILNVEVATLRRWRWAGRGPHFVKVGAAVRYDPSEIEGFIASGLRASTTGPPVDQRST